MKTTLREQKVNKKLLKYTNLNNDVISVINDYTPRKYYCSVCEEYNYIHTDICEREINEKCKLCINQCTFDYLNNIANIYTPLQQQWIYNTLKYEDHLEVKYNGKCLSCERNVYAKITTDKCKFCKLELSQTLFWLRQRYHPHCTPEYRRLNCCEKCNDYLQPIYKICLNCADKNCILCNAKLTEKQINFGYRICYKQCKNIQNNFDYE